jgi:hypothetical protein
MRLVPVAAAAVVWVAVLAGCSDGGTANETLPSSSTAAAQTTESLPPLGPADFPLPDEAREQTPEGAEAALRYYLELTTRQSGKTGKPLRDLSRDCSFCTFLADRYDSDAAAGYVITGGDFIIESFSPPAVHDDIAEFALSVTQTAVTVTGPDGQPVADRGSAELKGISLGASMTWSSQGRVWILNQLIRNN